MLKKSFVSLFFSPTKLQVLQLDGSKKKVKKHASIDLPKGIIENHRVAQSEALAKIFKTIWKKIGLKEKFVGIVVPEFSTFTKFLTLPKLDLGDLDEAVRWQAHDFLPKDVDSVVLDWKIIKEEKEEFQILVVSIEKEVLQSYVESVELAGLLPLVVETPSISLARIAGDGSSGRLILYVGQNETILVVAESQKIVGSSVISAESKDEIVKVSSKMLGFYKKIGVERVFIGGPKVNQELASKLKSTLGKPIELLNPKITGFSEGTLQEYLIPVSMQFKDPSEPSDEHTVNLLPERLVKKYEHRKLRFQIWSLTLFVSLIVWISFLASVGVYVFMGQQIELFKADAGSDLIPPENAKIISEIAVINQEATKILKIKDIKITPQVILNEIEAARPVGINVEKHRIDLEKGSVTVLGRSSDRQTLITFKQNLEEVSDFSLVQIPISSFQAGNDFDFELKFIYLPVVSTKPKTPAGR